MLAEASLAETAAWIEAKQKLLAAYPERIRSERSLLEHQAGLLDSDRLRQRKLP